MMIVIASLAVAIVCFIVYALERRSKEQPIDWLDAGKVTVFGGIISAAVVFAVTTDFVPDVVKEIDIPSVQDMFVGKPTF